jgi:hypothetical protein
MYYIRVVSQTEGLNKMSTVDFTNFHHATTANWTPCDRPDRGPNYVSRSGSAYWDTGFGVIRESDHWGSYYFDSAWFYNGFYVVETEGPVCGYAAYSEFMTGSEMSDPIRSIFNDRPMSADPTYNHVLRGRLIGHQLQEDILACVPVKARYWPKKITIDVIVEPNKRSWYSPTLGRNVRKRSVTVYGSAWLPAS